MLKITIVTVVKDVESTIKRCLDSILTQSYPNLEVIVIDGFSKDNTLSVINQLKEKKIKVYSFESLGIYDALNKGIKLSTGDVIGLLHGDDYLANQNVLASVAESFLNTNLPIVIGQLSFFNSKVPREIVRRYFPIKFKNWMFRFGIAPPHPGLYIKRELFEQYGDYRTDLEIAGDFDLMLRFLHFHRIPYTCVDELWVMMCTGGKSTSGYNSVIKNNIEIFAVCKSHKFYTNYIFIYAKYFFKILGVISR